MPANDPIIFMMGKFEARIPQDRLYAKNHLWLQPINANRDNSVYYVGLTAYSIRLLQDVYFLDWTIDPHTHVTARQEIGEIESSKALSSLYTPSAGHLLDFNEALLADPSAINTDGYGTGYLYSLDTDAHFLSPSEYVEHLNVGWEQDQRYLKGQVNQQ